MDYFDKKTPVGWIEIARAEAGTGMSEDGAAPTSETYVRTEHTAGWAKVGGGQLVTDAQKLVAAP